MNPPTSKGSPLLTIALAGLLLCALLGFAWWKSVVTTEKRFCRVCAAVSDRKTLSLYGRTIRKWDEEAASSDMTRNYFDRYLAYPHAHQWASPSGRFVTLSAPISSHPVGASAPPRPPAPGGLFNLLNLTDKGLQLVAASGIREAADRRRYFEFIIQQPGFQTEPDINHHLRVIQTWGKIYQQIPKDPSGKPAAGFLWSPQMEGITIPAEVKAGTLLRLPYYPPQVKGP